MWSSCSSSIYKPLFQQSPYKYRSSVNTLSILLPITPLKQIGESYQYFTKEANREELNDLPKALALSSGVLPGSLGFVLNAPPGYCWDWAGDGRVGDGDGPMSTEL